MTWFLNDVFSLSIAMATQWCHPTEVLADVSSSPHQHSGKG